MVRGAPFGPPAEGVTEPFPTRAKRLDLPEAVGDERDALAVLADAVGVQVVGADHHVDVRLRPVDAVALLADRDGTGLREAGAEGHVRRGVLVEQAVVVDATRLPDPRRRVDERDLTEALRIRDRREVAGEPVAVGVALRAQPHEAPVAELAREVLDHAAAEAPRPRAAERTLGRRRVRGDEALLRRHVHRDLPAPVILLA